MQLKEARPLQVHRKTDYPPMQTDSIWGEVVALRKGESPPRQIRKAARIKRFLDALILDLWVSATYEENPWRGVARDKSAYQKETRYRKLFFKYDLFVPLLDDLIELGYVEQKLGNEALGYRTRIKATPKLLDGCTSWDIAHVYRAPDVPEDETIIRKDEAGNVVDYTDTVLTHMWRKQLAAINTKLESSVIAVPGVNSATGEPVRCDTSRKRLFRVFNDNDWKKGGRFYGGFWMELKQRGAKQRELIQIDGEPCCELDFKATHATMAYNMQGLSAPEDSYTLPGFDRDTIKKAFLVLFNCEGREAALNAMRHEKHIKNAEGVLSAIEEAHPAIRAYFYQRDFGLNLQQLDSIVAAGVMGDLYKAGIVCLPIHDSFIVQTKHEDQLRATMRKWWEYHFNYEPVIDKKY